MSEYNELWGEVRSWVHGSYEDDVVRLSELESILEYAPLELEGDPALADYVRAHLKRFAPHAPEPRDPAIMRAWLSGQLLEVLGFMHDDRGIMGVPRYEESLGCLRVLEGHYANREHDVWASTSLIRGVVDVASAQAVFDYLSCELEYRSRSTLRVNQYATPESVDGQVHDLSGLAWERATEFIFGWESLWSGYGLQRQFSARMRLERERATLDLMGPSAFPVGVEALFELLVQLSRRSARFAPQFVSSDGEAKESFEALWRCVRAIRTRR